MVYAQRYFIELRAKPVVSISFILKDPAFYYFGFDLFGNKTAFFFL
jgi:hypothetical protein